MLWQSSIGHRFTWFWMISLLSVCRFVEFDTSVICHVFMHCFGSFHCKLCFKSPSVCFQGTKYEVNQENVVYLHSTLWRQARLWVNASPLIKPFVTPGGWHERKFVYRKVSRGLKCVRTSTAEICQSQWIERQQYLCLSVNIQSTSLEVALNKTTESYGD